MTRWELLSIDDMKFISDKINISDSFHLCVIHIVSELLREQIVDQTTFPAPTCP